jgi:hypothetical protein
MIQEYGALTLEEVELTLMYADLYPGLKKIDGYLLCAESIGWVKREKKGANTYYFALPVPDAATIVLKSPMKEPKVRRRQDIREYWKKSDPDRYRGIVGLMGGEA